jgi:GntR family transcriptional regulator, transcriptional repressor for pyruvate dehydrogenase complex
MAVTDEAILTIKQMILSGELRPGDRLPPEKELSERLRLSRNSMREAVKALEAMKVLDVRRGDGTFVTSLEPDLLSEALSFIVEVQQDEDSLLEIFAVRRILEPAAAALSASRLTDSEIDGLRQSVAGVPIDSDVDALVTHDLAFHAAIAAGAGNRYLSTLLDSLSGRTVRARLWRGLTEQDATDRTLREHAAIVEALGARDSALAQALTVAHIAGVERWLRSWTERTVDDPDQSRP